MIKQIEEYIFNEYGVKPEYLFKDDTAIFRNPNNKKWFCAILQIPARKLGINSKEPVQIINLKNHPANVAMLLSAKGIFPAYHMNKENWLTILIGGDIPLGMIIDLIDQSYQIIDKKK